MANRNSDVNKDDMFPARAEQGMIARSESKRRMRSLPARVIPANARDPPPANAREKRNRVTALSVNTHDPCQLAWEKDSTTAARIRQA